MCEFCGINELAQGARHAAWCPKATGAEIEERHARDVGNEQGWSLFAVGGRGLVWRYRETKSHTPPLSPWMRLA